MQPSGRAMRAPTAESRPRSGRRKRSGDAGLFASGGALFTAEKCRKRAGGCGPRSPIEPRGVHHKERHFLGRYAPPGHPAPYCPPLLGFARASRIGQPLRLQYFSLRPHELPRNTGQHLHTAASQPLSHGFAVTAPLIQGSLNGCKPAVLRTIFQFSP